MAASVAVALVTVSAQVAQAQPDHLTGGDPTVLVIAEDSPGCPAGGVLQDDWGNTVSTRPAVAGFNDPVAVNAAPGRFWVLNRCPQDYTVGVEMSGTNEFTVPGNSRIRIDFPAYVTAGQLFTEPAGEPDPVGWILTITGP